MKFFICSKEKSEIYSLICQHKICFLCLEKIKYKTKEKNFFLCICKKKTFINEKNIDLLKINDIKINEIQKLNEEKKELKEFSFELLEESNNSIKKLNEENLELLKNVEDVFSNLKKIIEEKEKFLKNQIELLINEKIKIFKRTQKQLKNHQSELEEISNYEINSKLDIENVKLQLNNLKNGLNINFSEIRNGSKINLNQVDINYFQNYVNGFGIIENKTLMQVNPKFCFPAENSFNNLSYGNKGFQILLRNDMDQIIENETTIIPELEIETKIKNLENEKDESCTINFAKENKINIYYNTESPGFYEISIKINGISN